ncbi:MAG: sel1 repeat family protein [Deltaproteobacteria bacterium]|nr:sel1 repeat family protein [Deltaproteobacteria bacterium]
MTKTPLLRLLMFLVLTILAGAFPLGCSIWPFSGSKDGSAESGSTKVETAAGKMKSTGELKPAGEDEFLRGDYAAAVPLLMNAGRSGSLRAVFFLRIVNEYGLDGQPPNPEMAERLVSLLAAMKDRVQELAYYGPKPDQPIYKTALALLYFRGQQGLNQDVGAALNLARGAAADFVPAMNLTAAILLSPLRPQSSGDFKEAFALTLKAAERGDALAMGNLSYLYRLGLGIDQEPFLAASWARKAADKTQTTPRVLNDLGLIYEEGRAVTQDKAEAARWYGLAAARNYAAAKSNVARLKSGHDGAPAFHAGLEY